MLLIFNKEYNKKNSFLVYFLLYNSHVNSSFFTFFFPYNPYANSSFLVFFSPYNSHVNSAFLPLQSLCKLEAFHGSGWIYPTELRDFAIGFVTSSLSLTYESFVDPYFSPTKRVLVSY